MEKRVVLALYRQKLRIARELGYTYGKWNKKYDQYNYETISTRKMYNLHRKNNLGRVIWCNVRREYKMNMHETDNEIRNDAIDYVFSMLQMLNETREIVKN